MTQAVAVTLLTGFLGAGKTTLLNHFLRHHGDASVAILENEFGAANIDGALLEGGSGSAWWSSATAASAAACGVNFGPP